ncbi:hypothetical protein FA95DRAFT_715215 [Auriscalpium vulgare]|uniref:Uncharacterized protein n=1 Tax=Auriscalpium vulgare TaxID=40419 RepID=A0ACB8RAS3_9AGAM|nr:hypothetical protein FA95DRAFT_715215 [Auriscalpium vulgare]
MSSHSHAEDIASYVVRGAAITVGAVVGWKRRRDLWYVCPVDSALRRQKYIPSSLPQG